MNNILQKGHIFLLLTLLFLSSINSSCSKDPTYEEIIEEQYATVFKETDYFIDMLDKIYEHYDALGSKSTKTSDGKYTVTPMGRLIIVKINSVVDNKTYEELKKALETHYRNNPKVIDCFVNNGGTVTIDCRK